jgi:hypothetical protein
MPVPRIPVYDGGALPGASQTTEVTITGGMLGGSNVVRLQDTTAGFGRIEKGARVELRDGRFGDVADVQGKRLAGLLPGSVQVSFGAGQDEWLQQREIVRIVPPIGAADGRDPVT